MDRRDIKKGRKSEPERLSTVLNAFVTGGTGVQKRMGEVFRLKRIWIALMGAHVSAISSPYRIKDKVLFVSVHDSMWIAELPYIKADMLEKLSNEGIKLDDIRFTLPKIYIKKAESVPNKTYPISNERRRWAERLASMISDERVRKAYLNALIANIERHKL